MNILPPSPNQAFCPKRLIDGLDHGPLKTATLHAAYSMQVCEDMMFLNILGGENTALNGKLSVRRESGHTEPIQLFTLMIANPGERKSGANAWAKRPLVALGAQQTQDQERAPRLHFDHVSGPSLIEELYENGGSLACHEPEPTALTLFGRRDFPKPILTKAYDGEAITLARARKQPIYIEDPAITMTISSQPEIAFRFGRQADVSASGLLARMLFLFGQPRAGTREVDTPPIPKECETYYWQLVTRLIQYPKADGGKRHILTLKRAAERTFVDFARQTEAELMAGRALSVDTAWGAKLPGKALRLAGLLHCVEQEDPAHAAIDDSTLRQAIEMCYVFVQHAQHFYFQLEHGEALEVAQSIARWAVSAFVTSFTAQQAQSALPRYSRRMINAGIDMLVRSGQAYEDLSNYQQNSPWRRGRKEGPYFRLAAIGGGIPQ